ncbi:uncharacterized protein TRAVEDRAFT_35446 [Trametes versicolor FP-101664 SS1]|uniref:uncharacterized protein n=1 Tax=Trametes versicolor (strain FP-101664) TaxID=717944 RepID=UPI0004622777|nr:uncharacterized protein TRAVEDRAFT_35446 [Trametes versicolor FP-101664 SS1]EIW62028.1 hypothetical protein TRAVEDRAFT_35446 [Trametes versicolor FP-101664 SS1]
MTHPSVVLAMILVAWLHLAAHLPFRFCDVVLSVIGYILVDAGQANLTPLLRTSLTGCLSALRMDPAIRMYPTCPACLEPHPEAVTADGNACCCLCSHPLFKIDNSSTRHGQRRGKRARAQPYLQTPAKSIVEQLSTLLAQPGIEEALDSWRRRSRLSGWLADFFDGAISKSLLGPDGLPFFKHDDAVDLEGELRIGLALGIDWFSYLRSLITPSYTSCPMSFNIVNLPPHLRYRASNLLLSMIIPGPKETDPDQTQRYVRVLVNELLRLWHKGQVMPTYRTARGRLVRVILVGVFCDKPAAHKIGGFGSHAHTFFCTRDWITQGLKATIAAFTKGGFTARTDVHHRKMMREYHACTNKNARETYAKSYATRWSELARLPYFDMCRMVVVDPMHNLFLGVVKTHFYHIWVQLKIFRKTKEIRQLHEILAGLQLPSKLGRLPKLIGEPAGGSLTADQWLILATIVGPLVLPALWDDVNTLDVDQYGPDFLAQRRDTLRETASARKRQQQAKRAGTGGAKKTTGKRRPAGAGPNLAESEPQRRSGRTRKPTAKGKDLVLEDDDAGAQDKPDEGAWVDEEDNEDDSSRAPQLHPRDLENFFKLCSALKLFLAESIDEAQLLRADALIREYCAELVELYGPEVIRPNHHYATHTAEFVRDYGPLREFWTFLFERLNKILKGYKTNNHEGGAIEMTFFREFHRATHMHRLLTEGVQHPTHAPFSAACRLMLDATSDNRGTLQQLAEELDEVFSDDNVSLSFSPRSATENLPTDVYFAFLAYLKRRDPLQPYHSEIAIPTDPRSKVVCNLATVFDHVVVGGHRYQAARRATTAVNSLVLVRVSPTGATWIGELQDVVLYENGLTAVRELFAFVKWLRPISNVDLNDTSWRACI